MSTPFWNGGGRRHSEGTGNHIGRKARAAALRFYGRLAAALAAGGVFAVLAYQSPGSAKHRPGKSPPAADRRDAVTEDGVLPLLDERRARVETEDAVGLARAKVRDPSRTTGDGTGDLPPKSSRRITRADQDDELLRNTTAAPHSRGPPGE